MLTIACNTSRYGGRYQNNFQHWNRNWLHPTGTHLRLVIKNEDFLFSWKIWAGMHNSYLPTTTLESLLTTMPGICIDKHNSTPIIICFRTNKNSTCHPISNGTPSKFSCNTTPKTNPKYLNISLRFWISHLVFFINESKDSTKICLSKSPIINLIKRKNIRNSKET